MSKKVEFEIVLDSQGAITGIKTLDGAFTKLDDSVEGATGSIDGYTGSTKGAATSSLAFANVISEYAMRAVDSLISGMSQAVDVGASFESKLAELSAITGITGKDLQTLGATARDQAMTTGVSINDQIEAYKLLASNIDVSVIGGVEGLKALQVETIRLAQASGVDLQTAANTTASAINQFGLSADQSARVVNVLAAGSKFGAAEVLDLGESMKNAGTTAALAGVSIEETVGAIEVMSQSYLKGAEAGTGLRNVITTLQSGSEELEKLGITPATLKLEGLEATLRKLTPILGDSAMMTEVFGRENLNAAAILIKNIDLVGEMTKRVTQTQVAQEQAAIQTDTFANAQNRLSAIIQNEQIKAFEALKPFLEDAMEFTGDLIQNTDKLIPILGGAAVAVGLAAAAWTLYTANITAAGIATAVATGGLTVLVAAVGAVIGVLATSEDAWEGLKDVASGSIDYVVASAKGLVENAGTAFELLWEIMKLPFSLLFDYVEFVFKGIGSIFSTVAQAFVQMITGDFSGAAETMSTIFTEVAKDFEASFDGAFAGISEKTKTLGSSIADNADFTAAESRISEGGSKLGKAFAEAFNFEVKDLGPAGGKEPEATKLPVATDLENSGIDQIDAEIQKTLELMEVESGLEDMRKTAAEEAEKFNSADAIGKQKSIDLTNKLKQAEKDKAEAHLKATERMIEMNIAQVDTSIKSAKDLGNAVLANLRREIQAYLASAVAGAVKNVFATFPFPISVAVAAAAGAAVNLAFNNLIPTFETGGRVEPSGEIIGKRHSDGGVKIEVEGGEFIINRKSTAYASDILEAINESPEKAKALNDQFVEDPSKGVRSTTESSMRAFEIGGLISPRNSDIPAINLINQSQGFDLRSVISELSSAMKNMKVTMSMYDFEDASRTFIKIRTS